jgi:UDP-N-acetylmuramate--alanine ligase
MTAAVLTVGGLDPTVMVGGVLQDGGTNLRIGSEQVWVVEADEYDRSFLTLCPSLAVVTSLEADHLDCYADLDAIMEAFTAFLQADTVKHTVLCGTDPNVRVLAGRLNRPPVFYGLDENSRFRPTDVRTEGFGIRFTALDGDEVLGTVRLRLPGEHNVSNALAAVAVGRILGIPWAFIGRALETYRGVKRRFEVLGEAAGVTVVSDYAHHPTEVRATLLAARSMWKGRVVAVFQPHLYSRTRDFASQFGAALSEADCVWLTAVYAAREAPLAGVTGATIAPHVTTAGGPVPAYAENLTALVSGLAAFVREGDLVLVMGAGDVDRAAQELYGLLCHRSGTRPDDG